jgi:hypothetical protein
MSTPGRFYYVSLEGSYNNLRSSNRQLNRGGTRYFPCSHRTSSCGRGQYHGGSVLLNETYKLEPYRGGIRITGGRDPYGKRKCNTSMTASLKKLGQSDKLYFPSNHSGVTMKPLHSGLVMIGEHELKKFPIAGELTVRHISD